MKYALTREDSRQLDDYTINTLGLPGMVLMENAGRGITRAVLDILEERGGLSVYILAGKGNNGGDGFVVARYLLNANIDVRIFHVAQADDYSGDAAENFHILSRLSDQMYHTPDVETLNDFTTDIFAADVLVDALLGTGIKGVPRSPYDEFIEWLNSYNAPTVAVDIPSGVDANSGQIPGAAVQAEETVTMGFAKTGLLFSPGREFAGEVSVVDIGIPDSALDESEKVYHIPEDDDIFYRLPVRNNDTYKHRTGKVFTLCGSRGFTGAATLVNEAVLAAGAGLIFAGVPESLNNIAETKMTEVITVPLPETEEGSYSKDSFALLQEHLDWSHVLAIGSGMGQNEETQSLIGSILASYDKIVVVDADACTHFTPENLEKLNESPGKLILTPHWGEFGTMTGSSKADLAANRLEIASEFAVSHDVDLVLKGAPTIIADAEGHVFINPTGNPGMATAGTGDVLTGLITGFAAQGLSVMDASVVSCYLHGLAGDLAAEVLTQLSLRATSLIDYLPEAIGYIQTYYEHI